MTRREIDILATIGLYTTFFAAWITLGWLYYRLRDAARWWQKRKKAA